MERRAGVGDAAIRDHAYIGARPARGLRTGIATNRGRITRGADWAAPYPGVSMIVRIEIHRADDVYEYRVVADGDVLFDDTGFSSVVHCLVAAVEGLPPEVRAVEVACGGVVSGTYPLTVLAGSAAQVAQHAVNTTAAVWEALQS